MLVRSGVAQRLFGTKEGLVAIKQLLSVAGIDIDAGMHEVEAVRLVFDGHQVVLSNGAETESLSTGPRPRTQERHLARSDRPASPPICDTLA